MVGEQQITDSGAGAQAYAPRLGPPLPLDEQIPEQIRYFRIGASVKSLKWMVHRALTPPVACFVR